jgi:hypothetical protein
VRRDPGGADRDESRLESIQDDHAVYDPSFVTCAIVRLREDEETTGTRLTTLLRDIGMLGDTTRDMQLRWSPESVPVQLALLDSKVTEHAAYGVAFAIVAYYAGLRVTSVAQIGDHFDFFVSHKDEEFGLEVSGTRQANLESLHGKKVKQFRTNPFGYNGYVVVVRFANRAAIFSYQSLEEPERGPATA